MLAIVKGGPAADENSRILLGLAQLFEPPGTVVQPVVLLQKLAGGNLVAELSRIDDEIRFVQLQSADVQANHVSRILEKLASFPDRLSAEKAE